eukprot:357660-Chlamydomonas_euryale.AAC.6
MNLATTMRSSTLILCPVPHACSSPWPAPHVHVHYHHHLLLAHEASRGSPGCPLRAAAEPPGSHTADNRERQALQQKAGA